jgi:hypothetical protein
VVRVDDVVALLEVASDRRELDQVVRLGLWILYC